MPPRYPSFKILRSVVPITRRQRWLRTAIIVALFLMTLYIVFGPLHKYPKIINIPTDCRMSAILSERVILNLTIDIPDTHDRILSFPECTIRYYKPFNAAVMPFHRNVTEPMTCYKSFAFAVKDKNAIFFNKTALAEKLNVSEHDMVCRLYSIQRDSEGKTDNEYSTKFLQHLSTGQYNASDEFIKITCSHYLHLQPGYDDFFAFIIDKVDTETKCDNASKKYRSKKRFNVVFIGIDALSHRNFLRYLPKTYSYLKEHFDLLEYHGYTKLGMNTFPCTLPLLTGKLEEELNAGAGPYDNLPLIWKNFSALGYRTLIAEDDPVLTSFNFKKKGFYYQPTDYYFRPMYVAIEESKRIRNVREPYCVNQRLGISFVNQWLKDFMTHFREKAMFAFSFLTELTHEILHYATYVDQPILEFFQWYTDYTARDNTFLIFFSDHGMRFGPFRQTEMGADEDNLPLLLVLPPASFRQQYPKLYKNMHINQHRLVTLFDVHEMLKDTLNFTGVLRDVKPTNFQRGISLFEEIPTTRTCDSAGIRPSYCPCHERIALKLADSAIIAIAKMVVDEINNITEQERTKCSILFPDEIVSFRPYVVHRQRGSDVKIVTSFHIALFTKPGRGHFSGIVECDDEEDVCSCSNVGQVQRINLYRNQSSCVTNWILKNYCYCVNL